MDDDNDDIKLLQNAVDSYEEQQEENYQTEDYMYSHNYLQQKQDEAFKEMLFNKNFMNELANGGHDINDILLNVNFQNLYPLNNYEEIKKNKIQDELQDISFAMDFGTIYFQQKFFAKYILIKSPTAISEKEKAETLQIKITTQKFKRDFYITQNEMGEFLNKFRTIYQQFIEIQSYLSKQSIQEFNKYFDFEFFVILEDAIKQRLYIKQKDNSFIIQWGVFNHKDFVQLDIKSQQTNQELSQEYYQQYLQLLFSNNIYQCYRDITNCQDLSKLKIIVLAIKNRSELFEFLLKVKITNISEKNEMNQMYF